MTQERGQVAVETVAMILLVVFTIGLMWQAILVGYTVMLASRAADQAARETATQMPTPGAQNLGVDEGMDSLPGTWRSGADIDITTSSDIDIIATNGVWARADVSLQIPLIVPGWQGFPISVSASSEARP